MSKPIETVAAALAELRRRENDNRIVGDVDGTKAYREAADILVGVLAAMEERMAALDVDNTDSAEDVLRWQLEKP